MKNLLALIGLLFLASCSHALHQVSMGDHSLYASPKAGKKVSVLTEQTSVMGFVFETDYVEQARTELMRKCPKGDVRNIMTRYSTSHGFFHWKNKIYMEGRCFTGRS